MNHRTVWQSLALRKLLSLCAAVCISLTTFLAFPGQVTAAPAAGGPADIAPPAPPPGSNIAPGSETTQVRMVAETVVLEVQKTAPEGVQGLARVTATFTMRNLGDAEERMQVRFPISANDGWFRYPEIRNVVVWVNGVQAGTRRITGPDPVYDNEPVPWIGFEVRFPPGGDVEIKVTFTAEAMGEYGLAAFFYVLHTGAGWKDTIGTGDLIVRLPYQATLENVIFGESTGFSSTTPSLDLSGNEARWHFENLEPARENDLEVSLVKPEVWGRVVAERENVRLHPQDGEAWGRLGKAYKESILLRRGMRQDDMGKVLYRYAKEAYAEAVALKPQDALWHLGYADLLFNYCFYHGDPGIPGDMADIAAAVLEIKTAYELAPNNERIQELFASLQMKYPWAMTETETGYDYPVLTATPFMTPWVWQTPTQELPQGTPLPQPSPAATLTGGGGSTQTAVPSTRTAPPPNTPTPPPAALAAVPEETAAVVQEGQEAEPSKGSGLQVCGAAVFLPLLVVLMANRKTPKRR